MLEKNVITSAIIAGGLSYRFGEAKEKYIYKGKPLLRYAVELAKNISKNIIAVMNEHNYPLIPSDFPIVPDIIKESGPLAGIHTALVYAETSYLAVIPGDMPNLTPEIYELLYHHLKPKKPVAVKSFNGPEPMVSVWPKNIFPAVEKLLLTRKLEMKKVLLELDAETIDIPPNLANFSSDLFLNINSKEDIKLIVL
ncbi:MAG: molybdenum cofactor guanylyltransferase [Calditrichota bacterium]